MISAYAITKYKLFIQTCPIYNQTLIDILIHPTHKFKPIKLIFFVRIKTELNLSYFY